MPLSLTLNDREGPGSSRPGHAGLDRSDQVRGRPAGRDQAQVRRTGGEPFRLSKLTWYHALVPAILAPVTDLLDPQPSGPRLTAVFAWLSGNAVGGAL